MATTRTSGKGVARPTAGKRAPRLSLAEVMKTLEGAGSEQTRKTYRRHGAPDPMFGVSFATMKTLVKRIGVDHELALALWGTGNHDARTLATKIADAASMQPTELDEWTRARPNGSCGDYVALLAAEGPHGEAKAREWLASPDASMRASGWTLAGHLATLDESIDDRWFSDLLSRIETTIHSASNQERGAMNRAMILIGGRSEALRRAATKTATRVGAVDVDHGDTACKTPDAATYIEKSWAHAAAKKFASPAVQERAREPMRIRC